MAGTRGRVLDVDVQNAALVRSIMGRIEDELEVYGTRKDGVPKTRSSANAALRKASMEIAERRVVPHVKAAAPAARPPQAVKVAATARARNDRLVLVQIGGTDPKLSGFRRRRRNPRWKGSVSFGAEYGPHPTSKVNPYGGAGRKPSGYFITPAVEKAAPRAREDYIDALKAIIARYSRQRTT